MDSINLTQNRREDFVTALENAKEGDELIYHIGERCSGPHKLAAFDCAEAGKCFLYQRRRGETQFDYIAKKPKKK